MTHSLNASATIPLVQPNAASAPGNTIPADALDPSLAGLPDLKLTPNKKMPSGVARNVKQHAYFLLDESTSMDGDKIDELNMAMAAILMTLGDPANKDGFRMTIIPFNHGSRILCSGVPVAAVPTVDLVASGSTNFDSPILKAIQEIRAHKSAPNPDGWHYLQPQVFFLSDGQASVADKNIQALQEFARVTAIAYGDDADQATLARIATDGQVHAIGTNGGALRDFLSEVGETMTATIQAAM